MADGTAKDLVAVNHGALTPAQYSQLAEVPPKSNGSRDRYFPELNHQI